MQIAYLGSGKALITNQSNLEHNVDPSKVKLELKNISKNFHGVKALQNVDFQLKGNSSTTNQGVRDVLF